jgi:hypothetical protein
MDTQVTAARRYADVVAGAFPTLIDMDDLLGQTFGFKGVPNGILVSPTGKIDAIIASRFEIRRPETRALVEDWLIADEAPQVPRRDGLEWSDEALRLFRGAAAAVRRGDSDEAVRLLKLAYPLEPDNIIIRKQLWAIQNPEKFYDGDVDVDWQTEQLAKGL